MVKHIYLTVITLVALKEEVSVVLVMVSCHWPDLILWHSASTDKRTNWSTQHYYNNDLCSLPLVAWLDEVVGLFWRSISGDIRGSESSSDSLPPLRGVGGSEQERERERERDSIINQHSHNYCIYPFDFCGERQSVSAGGEWDSFFLFDELKNNVQLSCS